MRERLQWQQATKNEDPAKAKKRRAPSRDLEHNEQVVLFNRIRTLALNDPRYALSARRTFAVPNGGGRSKREAGRLKAEGVTSGVSDIFCSVARGGWHGLYIEMKAGDGRATKEQALWIKESILTGYAAVVCWSADEAMDVWRSYVDGVYPDPSFTAESR